MHQKRTNKLFLLNTWRMALSTKRAFFCSFLNVVFLEKVICTFCLAKCIRKGKKKFSFWLHEEWLSTKITSFVLFALPNASEKDNKFVPFLTSWRMALTTKRTIILFLSERHLSKKERHLYFLPCQMHQKRTKKLFLLTTWRMALTTKWKFFLFFSERHLSRKKTSFVLFALPNALEKDKKIVPFDYMKNGSHHKKTIFFVLFWTSSF